jgi:hypothetical protein
MARVNRAGRIAAVVAVVAVAAVAGWWWRDQLAGLWAGESEPLVISPEAAAAAEEKLVRLREDGEPAVLSETEISSLLRFRSPAWASGAFREPTVRIAGDTLVLSGVVPTDRLPSHPDLDRVRPLLPDSSDVEVSARLRSIGPGRAALEIEEVEFAGLPVPRRLYGDVLDGLGRRAEPGLAPNAIALALPSGVGSARVQDGRLVLTP